jgi:hypothetical protein
MIIIIVAIALGWLMTHLKTQQALQWWHHRQSAQRHQEVEMVRDGVLQASFALRQRLELSLVYSDPKLFDCSLLDSLKQFHYALQGFIDQLSSPYLEDSLPLAIQALLESRRSPQITIQLQMPPASTGKRESYAQRRLLLMVLDELLNLVLSEKRCIATIAVCLTLTASLHELKIQFLYPEESMNVGSVLSRQFNTLQRVFELIMPGRCFYNWKNCQLTWYFRWRSSDYCS